MSRRRTRGPLFVRCVAWWLALGVSALSMSASAQNASREAPESVLLSVPDCHGAARDEVIKLVALELAPRMRVSEQGDRRAQLVGTVQCGAQKVVIGVEDPKRAPPLRVELDLLAAVPEARARLLALALAELITTSRLERAPLQPGPRTEEQARAEQQAQKESADEAAEEDEASDGDEAREPAVLELWLAPGLSSAGTPATALFGGELGVARAFGRVLVLVELQARVGEAQAASTEVAVRSFSALAAVAPLLIIGDVQLSVGAGARVGHVALSARALRSDVAGDDFDGMWFGPAAIAALELPLLGPGALRLGLEAGYLARGVVGLDEQDQELLAFRGLWLSAGLGFALSLR